MSKGNANGSAAVVGSVPEAFTVKAKPGLRVRVCEGPHSGEMVEAIILDCDRIGCRIRIEEGTHVTDERLVEYYELHAIVEPA